jgi:hypothetical protein
MAFDPLSAVPILGQLASGIGGAIAAEGDRRMQRETLERMLAQYRNIPLPVLQQLAPELLGQSAMEGVYADPALVEAQRAALGGLQDVARSGGMTVEDRAAMNLAQDEAARRSQAERMGVLRGLQARGLGSSGAAVGVQLAGQRDAADRASRVGTESAIEARRRALQALQQGGQMAGQMRGQAFGEASQRATAADRWAEYNANARTRTNAYNAGVPQQQFDNELRRTSGMANAAANVATNYGQSADRTQAAFANVGGGLAAGATEIARGLRTNYDPAPVGDDGIPYYLRRP